MYRQDCDRQHLQLSSSEVVQSKNSEQMDKPGDPKYIGLIAFGWARSLVDQLGSSYDA